MKEKLLCMVLSVVMSACAYAQDGRNGGYERRGGVVTYYGKALAGADASSFRDLGFGYAKDKNHVWMDGRILEYVDPTTFGVNRRYAIADGERLHGDGHRPEGVPQDTYKHRTSYFKTTFEVFYDGKKIAGAAASSFKELGKGYAKDAFSVYYRGSKIAGAVASSFKVLDEGYTKDAFNVYYLGNKIDGAVASSFVVKGNGYAKDAFNAYYYGKKLR